MRNFEIQRADLGLGRHEPFSGREISDGNIPALHQDEVYQRMGDVTRDIDYRTRRIRDAGKEPPEEPRDSNIFFDALEYLDRPANALRTALLNLDKGESFTQGLREGVTGETYTRGADILENIGVDEGLGRSAGGFGLEVLTDPLTYLGGFAARGAGSALRSASAPQAAIDLAEQGIFRSQVAPRLGEFGKGVRAKGITPGAGHQPIQETGEGVAGALGRAIGGMPMPFGGETATLGRGMVRGADAMKKLLATGRGGVRTDFDPSGIEGTSTYEETLARLQRAADRPKETYRQKAHQQQAALDQLRESPIFGMDRDASRITRDFIEDPVKEIGVMAREYDTQKRRINLPDGSTRKAKKPNIKNARRIMTEPEHAQEFERTYKRKFQELRSAPVGSKRFQKIQEEIQDMTEAKNLVETANRRSQQNLEELIRTNPELGNQVQEALTFIEQRNRQLAKLEGLKETQILPHYIYHMFKHPPRDVNEGVQYYKELSRQLSDEIPAHRERAMDTYRQLEAVADQHAKENKSVLLRSLKNKVSRDEYNRFKDLDHDTLVREARRRGVPTEQLELKPVLEPQDDVFAIQAAREMDSARSVANKQMMDDLRELGFLKALGKEDALPHANWIKTDRIPGLDPGEAIHPEMASVLQHFDHMLTDQREFQEVLHGWNRLQNTWKSSVTGLRPAWYQNTLFGNFFNGWLAGLNNPNRFIQAARAQAGGNIDNDLRRLGINMNTQEVYDALRREGIEGFGQMHMDIHRTPQEMLEGAIRSQKSKSARAKEAITSPRQAAAGTMNLSRSAGNFVETNGKLALFVDRLAKGDNISEAAATTRKFMFDYADLTRFERHAKMAIPFYTWTRKNLPLQMQNLVERPDRYLAVERAQHATHEAFGTPSEDIEAMPAWLRERAFSTPGEDTFLTPMLPYDTLTDFVDLEDPIGTAGGAATAMTSPFLTMIPELALNRDFFTGREIEEYPEVTDEQASLMGVTSDRVGHVAGQFGVGRDIVRSVDQALGEQEEGIEGRALTQPIGHGTPMGTIGQFIQNLGRQYDPEIASLYEQYGHREKLRQFMNMLEEQGIDFRTIREIESSTF